VPILGVEEATGQCIWARDCRNSNGNKVRLVSCKCHRLAIL